MLKSASSEGAGDTLCGHPPPPRPSVAPTGCGLPSSPKSWGLGQGRAGAGDGELWAWPPSPSQLPPSPATTPPPPCGFPLTSFNLICLEGSSVCPCYLLLPLAWSPAPTPGPRTCTEGCEINALKPNTLVPDDF